jgi:inosine-uridine nucleoside N-ribohydrolase
LLILIIRCTAENSVEHGAPRNTGHPELRQPLAFEVWQSVKKQLDPSEKITILTNGPLTNLANILLYDKNASSVIKVSYLISLASVQGIYRILKYDKFTFITDNIDLHVPLGQSVFVVGGHIRDEIDSKGNVFTIPSNRYAEFNMFLDPLAATIVLESALDITLIPLKSQRKAASFPHLLEALKHAQHTPESSFVLHLLSLLHNLQQKYQLYHHVVMSAFNYLLKLFSSKWKK